MSSTTNRDALLSWLNNHKSFTNDGNTYQELVDAWTECFFGRMGKEYPELSEILAKKQLAFYQAKYSAIQTILSSQTDDKKSYFVTIGFNHQTWDIPKCVAVINKVLSAPWVKQGEAVFELHRANGEHPHAHFVLYLENPLPKSKVVEKIFKLAGIKKVVLAKNFIDIKELTDVRKLYVRGIKQDAKMPYIKKDQEWRGKHNLPSLFTKL